MECAERGGRMQEQVSVADSIREMRKYGTQREVAQSEHHHHGNLDVEMQQSMKMFRAQRNFYIAGFSLFLWL